MPTTSCRFTENAYRRARRAVAQMRPDRGFDESAPPVPVGLRAVEGGIGKRGHERGVQNLQFRTRCALPHFLARVFRQAGQEAGAG